MARISLEEAKKRKIDDETLNRIKNFKEDFSDPEIPPLSEEELSQFVSARQLHPEWFKPKKVAITIRVDIDVLDHYKSSGKGYQTRMNADLRKACGLD
ncbi:MAG: BrnA antitoxin family protein [Erysipelotrichaceae bacterium]|nr:BrnA antitoxin family protein [Erysipelotrichaceae bacterium]